MCFILCFDYASLVKCDSLCKRKGMKWDVYKVKSHENYFKPQIIPDPSSEGKKKLEMRYWRSIQNMYVCVHYFNIAVHTNGAVSNIYWSFTVMALAFTMILHN